MKPLLEIAAFNIASARIAARSGADRIELCSGQADGGLTPPLEDILTAKRQLPIPCFVMIRPRGGNFMYNDQEMVAMRAELMQAKAHGADGFVFGILQEDGCINEPANMELVQLAHPLPCTFHRAFDDVVDKELGLEILIRCGFQRLLTSGGTGNAVNYCPELKWLIAQAHGRIIVMPGGGIRSSNIQMIQAQTNAAEYHSAAVMNGETLANATVVRELKRLIS